MDWFILLTLAGILGVMLSINRSLGKIEKIMGLQIRNLDKLGRTPIE